MRVVVYYTCSSASGLSTVRENTSNLKMAGPVDTGFIGMDGQNWLCTTSGAF